VLLSSKGIWLIAGLGNPGDKYINSRHNIGFKVVDYLSKDLNIGSARTKMTAMISDTSWEGYRLFLVKPLGYMNRSGSVLYEIARYFHIDVSQLIIVHDDVDIQMGTIKIKQKGGHGGHNGIRSVIESLGSDEFIRIRIGIGRPLNKTMTNHVLGNFHSDEQEQTKIIMETASRSIKTILLKGISQAMNQFNNKQILE
jgi:PTH1 family peptidyl-tRNA hydrolase